FPASVWALPPPKLMRMHLGRKSVLVVIGVWMCAAGLGAAEHTLSISGQRFRLNGEPFPYTAISFFNAIYNPTFNLSSAERKVWLAKFQRYGINVLRVWGQWDNKRGFVDRGPGKTLYETDGTLRAENVANLEAIIA